MISPRLQLRFSFLVALALLCAGCERAPSIDVIGSFFPVWMLCLSLGVALAFVARYFLLRYQLESEVGPLALFYPCVVILAACVLWLMFFR
jgi:hypothetical protein